MAGAQPLPCHMVSRLSTSIEQCKFIIDNECLEENALIDYAYLVYCDIGLEYRYASIVMVAFFVILIFLVLSAVADEFLCASLLAVSKNLRMSDSLAGVTLLAFGNGCPDIFSSLAAANDDRSEMIVGELLGAGIFCTSIVSGIIFITSDFKLACRPLLRDAIFYLLALYLIWSYCWETEITFYGALAFIIIYVIYLSVALVGQAIHSRLLGNYVIEQLEPKAPRPAATCKKGPSEAEADGIWFTLREESTGRVAGLAPLAPNPRAGSAEKSVRIEYYGGVTSMHLAGADSRLPERPTGEPAQLDARLCSAPANNKRGKPDYCPAAPSQAFAYTNQAFEWNKGDEHEFRAPPDGGEFGCAEFQRASTSRCGTAAADKGAGNPVGERAQEARRQQKCQEQEQQQQRDNCQVGCHEEHQTMYLNEWDRFLAHINPIEQLDWCQASWWTKIIRILRAPMVFVAHLSIPVVDTDRPLNNWCRPLNALHCITVPMFLLIVTKDGHLNNSSLLHVPVPVIIILAGALLACLVLRNTSACQAPRCHALFAYAGFLMSVLWIYLLASEMISLLKTFGIMFGLSDTAIGLGILAWGNSLGDIVANVSLAKAGYPRMALGACIGAPLLNLLLGFGLSFTLSLKPGESSAIEYSPIITLLCSTLVIILLSLMLATLAPPDCSKKPFGYSLIAGYAVYFTLAACLEYKVINF